jgi:integrase
VADPHPWDIGDQGIPAIRPNLRPVPDAHPLDIALTVQAWIDTIPETSITSDKYRRQLFLLDGLDAAAMANWALRPRQDGTPTANNTVRQRISVLRMFVRWATRNSGLPIDLAEFEEVAARIRRNHPKIYGKKQGEHKARYLSYDEAYGTLLDACKDGTWTGSRDQLVIRLGLAGLRAAEIMHLQWGHYDPHENRITCPGKKNRPRTLAIGPKLTDLLSKWRRHYERQLDRPMAANDPIIIAHVHGSNHHRDDTTGKFTGLHPQLAYGQPIGPRNTNIIFRIITSRARIAGLGHVAPHDLRRTAANILHNAKTQDGAHLYDLLDIQQVLDHADPATTQRSYIDELTANDTKARAANTLD